MAPENSTSLDELALDELARELIAREPLLGRSYQSATEVDQTTVPGFRAIDATGREITLGMVRAGAGTGSGAMPGTISQTVLRPVGGEVAVLDYLFTGLATTTRNTTVWLRVGDQWRAAHHQQTHVS